jgi:hypothetical protein
LTNSESFKSFLANIAIDNETEISSRYGEITKVLNKKYRDTESTTSNSLQVGSYGRSTAIKNISDLDMLYLLPQSSWERFKNNRQSALLQEVKNTILERYTQTDIRADGQVVVVSFQNHQIEVVPVFEQADGSFKYPDTKNGGDWLITRPRQEIQAIRDLDGEKNYNLRLLCKMIRAWKNKHGQEIGGLLVDTLAYNFLNSTNTYDDKSYASYGLMLRDFFAFLKDQPDQSYYLAPGSRQQVEVKKKFQSKAKKAYSLSLQAIDCDNQDEANKIWRKVFGRPFPVSKESAVSKSSLGWNDTEEFIEDKYPVDIRYNLEIDCEVSQNGYREYDLTYFLSKFIPLLPNKSLLFKVIRTDVPRPFHIEWKVLNRGEVAIAKNQVRGQILVDDGKLEKKERTTFKGEHIVECFAIKNGVVVAKDRIDVPIR